MIIDIDNEKIAAHLRAAVTAALEPNHFGESPLRKAIVDLAKTSLAQIGDGLSTDEAFVSAIREAVKDGLIAGVRAGAEEEGRKMGRKAASAKAAVGVLEGAK